MNTRYEASLNGIPLSHIAPEVLITDISSDEAQYQNETYTTAKRHGARIHRRYIEKAGCTITFSLREYDTQKRRTAINAIARWAKNGGTLKTSDRPGQMLQCVCENFPTLSSAMRWTDDLQISFAAYFLPFWQETNMSSISLSGTSGSGRIYVPGDVDSAFMEAIVHANGAISSVSLTVNDHTLTLANCAVAAGQELILSYDENMIQHISVSGASMLDRRTGADDLIAKCGEYNQVSFTTDGDARVTFRTRGLWL